MTRCYICVKQVNVNVCRYKIQDINDSGVLVHKHLCSFLSQIQGLCVRAYACAKVHVCEICARLGCNAALSGNSALTFRDIPSVPSSRLEDGITGLYRNTGTELSLGAALYPRRGRFHLRCSGSLKSCVYV